MSNMKSRSESHIGGWFSRCVVSSRWASVATARKTMIQWLGIENEEANWNAIMQAAKLQYPTQYNE
jgi:hypothetical protein